MATISYFRHPVLASHRNVQRTTRRDMFESHGPPLISHDGAFLCITLPEQVLLGVLQSQGPGPVASPESGICHLLVNHSTHCLPSFLASLAVSQMGQDRGKGKCENRLHVVLPHYQARNASEAQQVRCQTSADISLAASPAQRPPWPETNVLRQNCTLMAIRPAPDSSVPGSSHTCLRHHPLDWRAVRGNKQSGMPRVPLPAVTSRIGWAVDKAHTRRAGTHAITDR
jgi:hypothetical protein